MEKTFVLLLVILIVAFANARKYCEKKDYHLCKKEIHVMCHSEIKAAVFVSNCIQIFSGILTKNL